MLQDLANLWVSMRPKQWMKNFFIFSALLFVREFYDLNKLQTVSIAFVLFCLTSSAVYLLNDMCDLSRDRLHPLKRTRPLAAGKITARKVCFAAFVLTFVSLILSFYLDRTFGWILGGYVLLNILYSLFLKNIIVLDVIVIAIGFVLRVIAGAVIIHVPFSTWLVLCTFFLTLFLAINKRRSECALDMAQGSRMVLKEYSASLLEQMNIVALASTVISYTFYTFSSEHSKLFIITIPIVLYGLFYYLFAVDKQKEGDNGPSDVFLRERPLQLTVLAWILIIILILIYGH